MKTLFFRPAIIQQFFSGFLGCEKLFKVPSVSLGKAFFSSSALRCGFMPAACSPRSLQAPHWLCPVPCMLCGRLCRPSKLVALWEGAVSPSSLTQNVAVWEGKWAATIYLQKKAAVNKAKLFSSIANLYCDNWSWLTRQIFFRSLNIFPLVQY